MQTFVAAFFNEVVYTQVKTKLSWPRSRLHEKKVNNKKNPIH